MAEVKLHIMPSGEVLKALDDGEHRAFGDPVGEHDLTLCGCTTCARIRISYALHKQEQLGRKI